MASSSIFDRLDFSMMSVLGCFLLILQLSAAKTRFLPPTSATEAVKVSQLPLPKSGLLGLSPLIKPESQYTLVMIGYPESYYNGPQTYRPSYRSEVEIRFRCVQPTRRIAIHLNQETEIFALHVTVDGSTEYLAVKENSFNPADGTFYIDMAENFQVGVKYILTLSSSWRVIDEDDRNGIQAFNQTHEDTGDVLNQKCVITVDLSGKPKTMRNFVPCFDDPTYVMPYLWDIDVNYGVYTVALAMMNGERYGDFHSCEKDTNQRYSTYRFLFPSMAIEATQFRVVPFLWYPENASTTPVPPKCF